MNIEEYLNGMDEYIQRLNELKENNPKEAERIVRESLICSGVLDKFGNQKDNICEL